MTLIGFTVLQYRSNRFKPAVAGSFSQIRVHSRKFVANRFCFV
jgi:hypothetical protein